MPNVKRSHEFSRSITPRKKEKPKLAAESIYLYLRHKEFTFNYDTESVSRFQKVTLKFENFFKCAKYLTMQPGRTRQTTCVSRPEAILGRIMQMKTGQ